MPKKYDWITDEMFDRHLTDLMGAFTADKLLQIPGVYEACSEHFNNEVIEACEAEREDEEESEGDDDDDDS